MIYVLPVPASEQASNQFPTRARAIVMLMNPAATGLADPSLVRDVLGITLGEARIASLIGSGLSPKEAAEKLGITEENRAIGAEAGVFQGRDIPAERTGGPDRKAFGLNKLSA